MINVLDCMQCRYCSSLDIAVDNMKSVKINIERDCTKDIKGTPYILVELNPNIKQKISCKEFELGNKTMMDKLNNDLRKEKITAYFEDKFDAFLIISKYSKHIIIKENEIGMLYNCSVIFNPEFGGEIDIVKDYEIQNENNNCKYYKRKWWKFWVNRIIVRDFWIGEDMTKSLTHTRPDLDTEPPSKREK